ncbi:DUF6900 domain-containing protein [Avibacterium paragallinarum]
MVHSNLNRFFSCYLGQPLDFYDMGVWNIKRLMRAAYEAGYKAGVEK